MSVTSYARSSFDDLHVGDKFDYNESALKQIKQKLSTLLDLDYKIQDEDYEEQIYTQQFETITESTLVQEVDKDGHLVFETKEYTKTVIDAEGHTTTEKIIGQFPKMVTKEVSKQVPVMITKVTEDGYSYQEPLQDITTVTRTKKVIVIIASDKKYNALYFQTHLGYIKRNVAMQTGKTADFLLDLFPTIKAGFEAGQEVYVLTYDREGHQTKVAVDQEFLLECMQQLNIDFFGEPKGEVTE